MQPKVACFILFTCLSTAFAQPPGGPGPGGAAGDRIWQRNAFYGEAQTFDACIGHQPGNGTYHHHANPVCLRAQLGDNIELVRSTRIGDIYKEKPAPYAHSPILGWAFDGFPIYGPYGYSDSKDAKSAVRRMASGYRVRNITERTSLPDWALPIHNGVSQQLTAAQYGPKISTLYPIGRYLEDHEWVQSVGDLDQYNGRLTVTPEYPQGTYAYFITIDDKGTPAFPYIFSGQFYGTVSGGTARTIPDSAADYFNGTLTQAASTAPALAAWSIKNSKQTALVTSGYEPTTGPKTTWPTDVPSGVVISGGSSTPLLAEVQRLRFTDSTVYMNSNGLGSYVMGPWFAMDMPGGVFNNFPSNQSFQIQLPRAPVAATTKSATGGGTQGIWVNGVSMFNAIDGASYSVASGADAGGPVVVPSSVHVSGASFEQGPSAPGSLMAAFPMFGSVLATSTETASSAVWPTTLGGATVTVKDSRGVERAASIYYASPGQINYRIPSDCALGFATATVKVGSSSYAGALNIRNAYPNIFMANASGLAAATLTRVSGTVQTSEAVSQSPVDLGPATETVYLVLYGSGIGDQSSATATIGSVKADVLYAGAQGTYQGLDQYNVAIPRSLIGKGKVEVVLTVSGRVSNTVNMNIK